MHNSLNNMLHKYFFERGGVEYAIVFLLFIGLFSIYFTPALLQGKILAPGDALLFYLPALQRSWSLWIDDIQSGFPAFADPQFLTWSPLQLIAGSYNLVIFVTYALASLFSYAYIKLVTESRVAALFGAIVFSFGGFMIAHIGHLTIIHTAAWLPAILWTLERLARVQNLSNTALCAGAITLCFLGGHPQIFSYILILVVAYALYQLYVKRHSPGEVKQLLVYLSVLSVWSLSLAAIQLIPFFELATHSVREKWTFDNFVSYSLGPRELLLVLFPNIFGSQSIGWPYYFGRWNQTELACYAGLSALLLAAVAWTTRRRNTLIWFWYGVVAISLIFALGNTTPLMKLLFEVPVLNSFRAPARSVMLFVFAIAVLAAFGIKELERKDYWQIRLRFAVKVIGIIFIVGLFIAWSYYPQLVAAAAAKGIVLEKYWLNPAVWLPIVLLIASIAAIWFFSYRPRNPINVVPLVLILIIDLGSFGWLFEWRNGPTSSSLNLPVSWLSFSKETKQQYGRLMTLEGGNSQSIARPNLNLLNQIPVANGYGPLQLQRYATISSVQTTGKFDAFAVQNQLFGLMAVNAVVSDGIVNNQFVMGGDCQGNVRLPYLTTSLPKPIEATHIRITSHLGCSVSLGQGTSIADVIVTDKDSRKSFIPVRAGIETAEWAWERPDVASSVKHGLVKQREPFPASGFTGNWYVSELPLSADGKTVHTASIGIQWMLDGTPSFAIREVELINRTNNQTQRIPAVDFWYGDPAIWKNIAGLANTRWVKQNQLWNGRAWMTQDVRYAKTGEILKAVRAPTYDARKTSYIEEEVPWSHRSVTPGRVEIVEWVPGKIVLKTKADGESFVFISQAHYPGWEARIDNERDRLFVTNYAFQGVFVPPGEHLVVLHFLNWPFIIGAIISGLALFLLVFTFLYPIFRKRISIFRT